MDTTNNQILNIWQQNVNKSPICQHDLISSGKLIEAEINLIALQEPAINFLGKTIASRDWIAIYPTTHTNNPAKSRSIILLRATICTDNWMQVDFPSGDVTVVQLTGVWGKLTIFNIYNDCEHNNTIKTLSKFQHEHAELLEETPQGTAHTIWLGDFNRHHPYWDKHDDTRLFTKDAIKAAKVLIEATAEAGLEMALPSGLPTHIHNVTKLWSRLDQVFITERSMDLIIRCDTETSSRGINTDHLPILTKLDLATATVEESAMHNFREIDWEKFNSELGKRLQALGPAVTINTQIQLNEACSKLTKAIQETIADVVPIKRICAKTKRWWTKELTTLRKKADKSGRLASKLSHLPYHHAHIEHENTVKLYRSTLESTKRQHWWDWLEKATDLDIWTVNKLINSQATDGGKCSIPQLKYKNDGVETTATSSEEKGNALAKSFFPTKPSRPMQEDNANHKQCCKAERITKEQISRQLRRIKPYKAPGPDGIPNIVLTKCADLLVDRLLQLYTAMYEKKLHYEPWKCFTTIVLRKPGKPRYDTPKAYRPIALLNTMAKVLTGIIAEHLSYYTEKYRLLPDHHFGGRPGRTTADALHLLTYRIKGAWRKGEVASVLFLDIEGAFPNAVPEILVRNLRRRGVPTRIINFTAEMLRNRETRLRFDDYTSEAIPIDNGIGQCDPLSMGLYQFYNADLLDIPSEPNQLAIAYVDDAILYATGSNFEDTHKTLTKMMTMENGVINWSKDHNSPLEYTKLALIDFAHQNRQATRPDLILPHGTIKPKTSVKYLGVILDQHLTWAQQRASAIEKGTQWTSQIRRIAKPGWGITPKYARRLYISVALPRILYGADVWYTPSGNAAPERKRRGTGRVIKKLASVQRVGALAITGGLRTSPTDTLDALANLLPFETAIEKWCYRAAIRLATLPDSHPLRKPINKSSKRLVRKHASPLHNLMHILETNPRNLGTKNITTHNPTMTKSKPFKIKIPPDKETSKQEAQHIMDEIQVYMDGSIIDGKVGAAAILTRPGHDHRILRYQLGDVNEQTIYDAELVGILMGVHLIKTEKAAHRNITLGADSQAAIKAVKNELSTPGHYIANQIIRTTRQISKVRSSKYSLTIRWTAGHMGIDGNELVDSEAKKAAKGQSTDPPSLPAILRKKLKVSAAALKQSYDIRAKKKWEKSWTASQRGKRDHKVDESSPSKKFLDLISNPKLPRQASSLISQMCITHIPLNSYLYRFKRADKANCPACGESKETLEHYLLYCPAYAHKRWALRKATKNKLTMKTLLGEKESALALKNYNEATHRFEIRDAYTNTVSKIKP